MESKNADKLRRIGYVIVLLVVSLPLFCGYILEGGDVVIWIRRIDEVRAGFRSPWNVMFPTPALIAECGGEFSALNSNLWLFLPAFFRWLGFSITNTYRIYILLLNLLALWGILFPTIKCCQTPKAYKVMLCQNTCSSFQSICLQYRKYLTTQGLCKAYSHCSACKELQQVLNT